MNGEILRALSDWNIWWETESIPGEENGGQAKNTKIWI